MEYTITDSNGGPATIYTYDSSTETYNVLNKNGTVSYNPEDDPDNLTGTVTVYLDPGTYTVSETKYPSRTEKITVTENSTNNAADKKVTLTAGAENETRAIFYNRETLGEISIYKTGQQDGSTSPLAGATFGLYSDASCTDGTQLETVTTGSGGSATFERLVYGTYYVKEITAPAGYILDDTVYTCVVSPNGTSVTSGDSTEGNQGSDQGTGGQTSAGRVESVNRYNEAAVRLQKQVYNVNTQAYVDVNATNYGTFSGRFSIERKNSDGTWSTVDNASGLSPGQDGRINQSLDVYDADGTAITYRFVEVLPEGWHAAKETTIESDDGTSQRVAYSEEFTLEDYLGNSSNNPKEITMKNDRNGSIALTKNFYTATAQGMTVSQDENLTASFDLYYTEGEDGTLVPYNTDSYTLASGDTLTITDLPRTSNGEDRYYYLVENTTGNTDYLASEDDSAGINGAAEVTLTIDGNQVTAYGPFNFTEEMTEGSDDIVLAQSITINNVEQKVPVVVRKQNSYTNAFVPGASYAIYLYDNDTEGDTVVTETDIASASGSLAALEPGHKYIVEEIDTPARYTNVTPGENLIIDLSDIEKVTTDTDVWTVTLLNRPDPSFQVTKVRDNAMGSNTPLTNVQFEVYTKEGDIYTRVKDYSGEDLTITAETPQQIPAGTYYLKEIVPEDNPNEILDSSEHQDLYNSGVDKTTDSLYFGPYEVVNQQAVQDFGSIVNYSEYGAVTVTKQGMNPGTDGEAGTPSPLAGATIGIYNGDTLVDSAETGENGQVTFIRLPIYDENGAKIHYTIKEIQAPEGYTASSETFDVTLTPGETVTTGKSSATEETAGNSPLALVNQPETELIVEKRYYNVWEHTFTDKEYLLPGTVIALYRYDAESGESGTYYLEKTQSVGEGGEVTEPPVVLTTDETGRVTFEGLAQDTEYVAVEVCVPDGEDYQYLVPQGDDKEYLNSNYLTDSQLPDTITAADMAKYNYVRKPANTTANAPVTSTSGTLVNVENWAQLQIEKYVVEDEEHSDPDIEGEDRRNINNAEFILYREILPDNTENDADLAFDQNNLSKYTEIGTYYSGTLYNADGTRMDGWFATDILNSGDNVVYWLVETDAGIGASINPANVVTLIKHTGTDYTNVTHYTYTEGGTEHPATPTNTMDYVDNQVSIREFQNIPAYGPGTEMYSTVRIAKWAGSRDSEGAKENDFTPLGNVTFNLYLADSEGNLYDKLDTLTTGLDNQINTTGNTGDDPAAGGSTELNAWASSKAFEWSQLSTLYHRTLGEELYDDIFSTDEAGNGYVRVAIQESSAPNGYLAEKDTYYMYMFFENGGGSTEEGDRTTEIFNDAYYVKGDGSSADEDANVPLADNQDPEITWAIYPTTETEDGYVEYNGNLSVPESDGDRSQYRLVNWPVDTQAVTVQKYGYELQEGTPDTIGDSDVQTGNLNMSSEELDAYYADGEHTDRVTLGNVTMRLQRYVNGRWENYQYAGSDTSDGLFTTNATGYFAFPDGLQMGSYRIIEVTPSAQYEKIYDGSDVSGGADETQTQAAYYFQVSNDTVRITMYNPKKQELSVKKTDMGNTNLEGVTFELTNTSDSSDYVSGQTGDDGTVVLSNIGSGTYTLKETLPADSDYTDSYFAQYFAEQYGGDDYNNSNGGTGNLSDLVGGDGIFLGLDTSLKTGANGTSVQVTKLTDISDYGITDPDRTVDLTIKNPERVSFTIKKEDADTGEALSGATFQVDYIAFPAFDRDVTSRDVTIGADDSWTTLTGTYTTDATGLVTVEGNPGVYRITETGAPGGYNITDASPKYIALTGGLNIGTVTVNTGNDNSINVTPAEDGTSTGDLLFQDDEQVSLTVTKTIRAGSMPVSGSHSFTFTLYNSSKEQIDSETITTQDGSDASATFDGLSQDTTYYVRETSTADGFTLTGITYRIGSGEETIITPDNGYYPIVTSNTATDVSVTATNTYLRGQVSIAKVDGETGTLLSDAGFKVV